ncbi:MAG: hypothetical protein Pars93KO_27030 [Parasphingorhabdus sp.]
MRRLELADRILLIAALVGSTNYFACTALTLRLVGDVKVVTNFIVIKHSLLASRALDLFANDDHAIRLGALRRLIFKLSIRLFDQLQVLETFFFNDLLASVFSFSSRLVGLS